MAKPISVDLRERVCEAESEGLSRHQAAARFKVSASSAIRWQAQKQASGTVAPARVGGDRRSERIEAEAAFILAQIEARPDIVVREEGWFQIDCVFGLSRMRLWMTAQRRVIQAIRSLKL